MFRNKNLNFCISLTLLFFLCVAFFPDISYSNEQHKTEHIAFTKAYIYDQNTFSRTHKDQELDISVDLEFPIILDEKTDAKKIKFEFTLEHEKFGKSTISDYGNYTQIDSGKGIINELFFHEKSKDNKIKDAAGAGMIIYDGETYTFRFGSSKLKDKFELNDFGSNTNNEDATDLALTTTQTVIKATSSPGNIDIRLLTDGYNLREGKDIWYELLLRPRDFPKLSGLFLDGWVSRYEANLNNAHYTQGPAITTKISKPTQNSSSISLGFNWFAVSAAINFSISNPDVLTDVRNAYAKYNSPLLQAFVSEDMYLSKASVNGIGIEGHFYTAYTGSNKIDINGRLNWYERYLDGVDDLYYNLVTNQTNAINGINFNITT